MSIDSKLRIMLHSAWYYASFMSIDSKLCIMLHSALYYASFMSIDSKLTGACLSTQSFVLCLIHCSSFTAPHSPAHLWVWWLVGLLTCRAILLTCLAILLPCRAMLLTCRTILLTCLAMPSVAAPCRHALLCLLGLFTCL